MEPKSRGETRGGKKQTQTRKKRCDLHFKPLQLISKSALKALKKTSPTGFEMLMGKVSQKNKLPDAPSKAGFLVCWLLTMVSCGAEELEDDFL